MKSLGIKGFIIDCDMFTNPKVNPIIVKHGPEAERVLVHTLMTLYSSDSGYFLEFTDDIVSKIAKRCGYSEKKTDFVVNVVEDLVEEMFFNKDIYWEHTVLTSQETQRRWKAAAFRRNIDFDALPHWILGEDVIANTELIDVISTNFKYHLHANIPKDMLLRIDKKIKSLNRYTSEYGSLENIFLVAIRRMLDCSFKNPPRFFFSGLFGNDQYLLRPTAKEEENGSYIKLVKSKSNTPSPEIAPKMKRMSDG